MDAAIYARLSKNRRGLSDNCEIQIAEAEGYSEDKVWPVVGTFQDDDISASKYSTKPRPDYDRLVQAIEAGQVEVIVCTEMTRLYRRLEELLELIKMAERTRLRGIWTTDDIGYDLSTPEGIHAAIGAVNNAMLESAKLSKRQRRKKAAQARQGKPSGGGRPYGYEQDGITLIPAEVAVLVEAKDRYLAGETMRDLIRDFFNRGIVAKNGKTWDIENFQRMLFNKRYIGIRTHNGAEYPAIWPAIFTADEWNRMDARRRQRVARYPGKQPGTTRQYLLTGLVYCGRCDTGMIGSRRAISEGHQRRYRCRAVDNHGMPLGCGKVFRGAEPLDEFITEAVLYRFDSPEVASALSVTGEDPDAINKLMDEYQTAKQRLDQMVADYASGFLNRDQFAVAKTAAEINVQTARDALGRAQNLSVRQVIRPDQTIREAFEDGGLDLRHSIISLLVERIVCLPSHPGSHVWHGYRFDPGYIEVNWRV
jgi:site-specific DNA recombinase